MAQSAFTKKRIIYVDLDLRLKLTYTISDISIDNLFVESTDSNRWP